MDETKIVLRGVVHGKSIELEQESGLPDGEQVNVIVQAQQAQAPARKLPPGEGIRQSAGGWADAGDEFEVWLEEMNRSRQLDRPEIP